MRVLRIALLLAAALHSQSLAAQERKSIRPKDSDNPLTELISGYEFTPLKTRALQDDDFDNPGFAWVSRGERLWSLVEGAARKSCSTCHGSATQSMRAAGAAYPKFEEKVKTVINLEQRINQCRTAQMKAAPWPYESEALLDMVAYVKSQARGLPVDVKTDGPARETFERGRALYEARVGQFGMSCALCHNEHYNKSFRAEVLSQGHSNGYPAYQMKTRSFISLHQRFRNCYVDMRAEPYDPARRKWLRWSCISPGEGRDFRSRRPPCGAEWRTGHAPVIALMKLRRRHRRSMANLERRAFNRTHIQWP
jgi:sulfur-oxidizing protein SoxA